MNARVTARRLPVGASELNFVGATPFLLAARTADVELMRLLLELGADPRMPTDDRHDAAAWWRPASAAALPGEEPGTEAEVLQALALLLTLGADVNAVDDAATPPCTARPTSTCRKSVDVSRRGTARASRSGTTRTPTATRRSNRRRHSARHELRLLDRDAAAIRAGTKRRRGGCAALKTGRRERAHDRKIPK